VALDEAVRGRAVPEERVAGLQGLGARGIGGPGRHVEGPERLAGTREAEDGAVAVRPDLRHLDAAGAEEHDVLGRVALEEEALLAHHTVLASEPGSAPRTPRGEPPEEGRPFDEVQPKVERATRLSRRQPDLDTPRLPGGRELARI